MLRLFLAILLAALMSAPAYALNTDDAGQAAKNCQGSIQFNAGNSAKQCHDLGKIYDGSCVVGLKAVNDGYIAMFPYDCSKGCSTRPEEFGWEGGGTAATVNACHNGCMYSSALDPLGVVGFAYAPTGAICSESDAPAPTPAGDDSGGDDGGGTGGETGGGDGGGNDGGGNGGDGGSGGDSGGGDGNGDGDGEGDGGGDGDGNGDGGENPSLPGDPQYPGDIPMPYMDPPIPSSYMGQWSSSLGGGSCPAPLTIGASVGGYNVSITFEFKPLCDFAIKIRAMLIAFSAIVAVYIIVGLRR